MGEKKFMERHNLAEKDRVLTEFEVKVLRKCHHDFCANTQKQAAQDLGVSQTTISRTLARLKKRVPKFFPILTLHQAVVWHYLTEGLTREQVVQLTGYSLKFVDEATTQLKAKGLSFGPRPKTLQYSEFMDSGVKQKF